MTVINDLETLEGIETKRVLIKGTYTKFCSIADILEEKVPSGSWAEAAKQVLLRGTCQTDTIEIEYVPEAGV